MSPNFSGFVDEQLMGSEEKGTTAHCNTQSTGAIGNEIFNVARLVTDAN